jgi:molybdopterin/thiamine biosynthesis adenylyltransferase
MSGLEAIAITSGTLFVSYVGFRGIRAIGAYSIFYLFYKYKKNVCYKMIRAGLEEENYDKFCDGIEKIKILDTHYNTEKYIRVLKKFKLNPRMIRNKDEFYKYILRKKFNLEEDEEEDINDLHNYLEKKINKSSCIEINDEEQFKNIIRNIIKEELKEVIEE